jgi:hypothetical protein
MLARGRRAASRCLLSDHAWLWARGFAAAARISICCAGSPLADEGAGARGGKPLGGGHRRRACAAWRRPQGVSALSGDYLAAERRAGALGNGARRRAATGSDLRTTDDSVLKAVSRVPLFGGFLGLGLLLLAMGAMWYREGR